MQALQASWACLQKQRTKWPADSYQGLDVRVLTNRINASIA